MGGRWAPFAERFSGSIDRSGDCWVWTGSKDRKGYGRIYYQGRRTGAHRVAWELSNGPILDGLHVCHHCDNPPCVNTGHLFLGTHADNMLDRDMKGRGTPPPYSAGQDHWTHRLPERRLRGERHGRAKLTDAQVVALRVSYLDGGVSMGALADRYGVGKSQVSRLVRGLQRREVA
jgi:hypothetical protein